MKKLTLIVSAAVMAVFTAASVIAHEGHVHDATKDDGKDATADESADVTVKGEVIDFICYVDHNATGEKHVDCAKKCITSGLPVGLKGDDGKTYLLVGEHVPMNKELAEYAAKTITIKGKLAARDGVNMIENAEIQK